MRRPAPALALALVGVIHAGPGAVPPPPLATGVAFRPTFTPDGEAVVFGRPKPGELVLLELATGVARPLGEGLPATARPGSTHMLPTPDGAGVVFAGEAREWAGYTCPDRDLWLAPRAGGPARRLGECYTYEYRLEQHGMRPGSPWLVHAGGAGEGIGLFAARLDRDARVRLDAPAHEKARVETWVRHGADRVAYVADSEAPGRRRLFVADLADPDAKPRDLTAELPAGLVVCERLSGRSDMPGDKDALRFSPDGATLVFAAQPADADIGGWASLWAVDLAGGAPRELFPAASGWGTQTFSFSPDGKWVCLRNFDQGMSVGVAAVDGSGHRFVNPPTVGWQWTNHPVIPAGSDRVWFWGDVETPDQQTFLYSADLREDDLRREELALPRAPAGLLDVVPTRDGAGFLARGHVRRRDGFRLAHVPFGGVATMLSEDNRYGNVVQFEELPGGRVAVLEALHTNLPAELFVVTPGGTRTRVSPELPPHDGVAAFAADPTGRRAALVLRRLQEPTRLVVVELPEG